jgi:hypothetical protein
MDLWKVKVFGSAQANAIPIQRRHDTSLAADGRPSRTLTVSLRRVADDPGKHNEQKEDNPCREQPDSERPISAKADAPHAAA